MYGNITNHLFRVKKLFTLNYLSLSGAVFITLIWLSGVAKARMIYQIQGGNAILVCCKHLAMSLFSLCAQPYCLQTTVLFGVWTSIWFGSGERFQIFFFLNLISEKNLYHINSSRRLELLKWGKLSRAELEVQTRLARVRLVDNPVVQPVSPIPVPCPDLRPPGTGAPAPHRLSPPSPWPRPGRPPGSRRPPPAGESWPLRSLRSRPLSPSTCRGGHRLLVPSPKSRASSSPPRSSISPEVPYLTYFLLLLRLARTTWMPFFLFSRRSIFFLTAKISSTYTKLYISETETIYLFNLASSLVWLCLRIVTTNP